MSEEGKRKIGIHRKKVCSHLADTLNAALTDAEQQDLSDIYDRLVIYFKKWSMQTNRKNCKKRTPPKRPCCILG